MGCAQTTASVIPANHVPIERLYGNEGYPIMSTPPVVVITAPPTPAYVKSALKKTHLDERGRPEKSSFLKRKPIPLNKSVNFDEQVQVKSRTPTPSKIWYEKASTTMPMRKDRRNNNDEVNSISSDEEEENNNERIESESQLPILGYPISLSQPNQANTSWYKNNSIGVMPLTNTMIENGYPSLTNQQSSFNMNTYATENQTTSPGNRIKVRRKLSSSGPPQTLTAPSYSSPVQSLVTPSNPSSAQFSSATPAYQPPVQSSTVPSYQVPIQPPMDSSYQTSVQLPGASPYQSSIQPSPQTFHLRQTLPNTNAVPIEHPTPFANSESSPSAAYYAFTRRPIENVT